MYSTECAIDGCQTYVYVRGWCQKHYATWQRNGNPLTKIIRVHCANKSYIIRVKRTCATEGCKDNSVAKDMCQKHYARYIKYGDPQKVLKVVTGNRHNHPLYKLYYAMLGRCNNPNNTHYTYYGGRGITVDDRWLGLHGFDQFIADMGDRPKGLTLDRMDNSRGYSPENCQWATRSVQQYNQRIPRTNTSGYKGVTFYKTTDKWTAQIQIKGKKKHLGYFNTIKEAVEARKKAEAAFNRKDT